MNVHKIEFSFILSYNTEILASNTSEINMYNKGTFTYYVSTRGGGGGSTLLTAAYVSFFCKKNSIVLKHFYLFCLTLLCKVNEFQLTILYLVLQRKSMFDSVSNNHCFILLSKCYSKELNVARWQYCQRERSQRRRSLVANRLAGIIANNIGLLFLTLFTFSV